MMNWSDNEEKPVRVTVPSQVTLLENLSRCLETDQGFSVATLNLDHVVKLGRDPEFYAAYVEHSHITADGNPIVWLSRLAGQQVDLVPGSELIEPISALAARAGVPLGLFGSNTATLEATATALEARNPGLEVVMRLAPPMGFDPQGDAADAAIETIRESGARIVFLALGAPKQEIFAARAQAALPHVGFLSIGAGLDFIAQTQTRAPKWVRMLAAEWLWRLVLSPRRLAGRYAACLVILPELTLRALKLRRKGS